ncbi:hypothetical protein H6G74_30505 [Nostoc spongiaeforme FACHB-130]|uniref:Integral membrane protein n=1 Tax=Nostoc spongiaeforme FACHB-130 TaxID=1357510 RepID=A0ABR8G5Y3_9NOSO|nr:hypothetical protein [Nostoc spongiaeforme]MBD2598596.1 hypothetical protein [Nostoc spongiaeforme FACHB-130]
MPKLNVKQKNWLLSAHVAFGSIWFGTAVCMIAIALKNSHTTNGDELYAVNAALKLLDDFVIIPTANLSLLTGGLLCWLTIWGFFKHYWVIFKWVATVTLITTGTVWLGPWLNAATSISDVERSQALSNPLYNFDIKGVLIGGAIQTCFILAIIAVSVLKPWGRRIIKSAEASTALKTETKVN